MGVVLRELVKLLVEDLVWGLESYIQIYTLYKKSPNLFFFFFLSFFLFGVNSLLFIFLEPHLYMLLVDQSQILLKGNSTAKAIYSNQLTSPFYSETLERWTGGYVYLFGSYIFERLLEVIFGRLLDMDMEIVTKI